MKSIPTHTLTLHDVLNTVSQAYVLPVYEALVAVASKASFDKLRFNLLLGGMSNAKTFQCEINGKKYALRLLDEAEPAETRKAELAAHQLGAQLKIAPQLLYADQVPLVLLMEFIEGRMFSRRDLDDPTITKKVMHTIKKFHQATTNIHLPKFTMAEIIKNLYHHDKTKNSAVYPSCFEQLHSNLQTNYTNLKTPHLPCHGDFSPDNILIANDGNVYFIDWTLAKIDNPFLDIGWLACFAAADNDHVKKLVQAYLERTTNKSEIAEACFFRDLTVFYVATFWIGQQKESNQAILDKLLNSPIKKGFEYVIEGIIKKDIFKKEPLELTLYALGWIKEYISNQALNNSVATSNPQQIFLLILGVSGAGKSTIIQHLEKLDSRIAYIKSYITRPLRPQENNKVSISLQEMKQLEKEKKVFAVNRHCGVTHGIPSIFIETARRNGQIPVLDFSISNLSIAQQAFGEKLFCVYVAPPDLATLKKRLAADGRDKDGKRFLQAQKELELFSQGAFDHQVNKIIINHDGDAELYAREILEAIGIGKTKK